MVVSKINPEKITFARERRKFTKKQLASFLGITARTLQNYEQGISTPDKDMLTLLSEKLDFPESFFIIDGDIPEIKEHGVSFRKLSKMTEAMKRCIFASGAMAFMLNQWLEERFHLPASDLPDLSELDPETAAVTLRSMWGLGYAPIPNMINLLESKGIRIFSLPLDIREVDAFCTWHENVPYIFLHTGKSGERSRFDAAHELGHLVMDAYSMRHGGEREEKMEKRANEFAAAFLMPKYSVIANQPPAMMTRYLMKLKHHWGVSLAALVYRLNALGLLGEWHHRTLCMEIAKKGWRTNEPEPMDREISQLLPKVFDILHNQGQDYTDIARILCLAADEIDSLSFGQARRFALVSPPRLRLVRGKAQIKPLARLQQAVPAPENAAHV